MPWCWPCCCCRRPPWVTGWAKPSALFLAGLVIFTAGSLACALAWTALALELFRALQGVGGAVLFATATPLLRAEFSGAALARALGAFGATIGAASAIWAAGRMGC